MKRTVFLLLAGFIILTNLVTGQTTEYRCYTWEKLKSSGPDLRQIGEIGVKHSKDIHSSSWSVGCETLDRDQAKFSVYKEYLGELGVKHARLQSGWAKSEKQKGIYNYEWLDSCVYGLVEQSIKPWICLCYGNPIYGSDLNLGAGVAALVNSEDAMAAWLKYVEITVNRYKNVVNEWEVWNEPYGQEKEYSHLLVQTSELIRKIQPESVIIGEILWETHEPGIKELLEALRSRGKLNVVDYWAFHSYRYNPDECYPILNEFINLLKSYNPDYKIVQGEVGCPSQLEWTHALDYYPWTEYSQAKWDLRRMAGDRVRNIPSSIFTIIDLRYSNMLQSFGLIRSNLLHEFIYKRPAYYGVQHMASFFDDAVIAMGELECQSNSSREITVAGFEKEETPVVLIWYKDQIPSDNIEWDPVDIKIKAVNFNDPVYVEMITGKVYEIDKTTFKTKGGDVKFDGLPLWDSPIMIAERSQVPMIPKK
ncbi:MAG: glycoside hydrolase [Lentimicrobium sp.]|nr:glycoside hydrolase [Lentimicrobium sp.]